MQTSAEVTEVLQNQPGEAAEMDEVEMELADPAAPEELPADDEFQLRDEGTPSADAAAFPLAAAAAVSVC